jgi:hypothetical protein
MVLILRGRYNRQILHGRRRVFEASV